ncbi:hypothetical protein [Kangiella sp.]|uniref:hypothetical protein n=1 Tax=Kangiella sp. TaxID=1920245 RepID=UPI003A95BCD0
MTLVIVGISMLIQGFLLGSITILTIGSFVLLGWLVLRLVVPPRVIHSTSRNNVIGADGEQMTVESRSTFIRYKESLLVVIVKAILISASVAMTILTYLNQPAS